MADISKIILPGNSTTYNLKDANAARVWFGTSDTAAGTASKSVTISGFDSNALKSGAKVVVKFNNAQSNNGVPSLNVSSTGAKNIYYSNGQYAGLNAWTANAIVTFTYYSNVWYMDQRNFLTLSDLPVYDGTVT